MQRLQSRGADAALRHVDDALESEIVGRLMHEAQIGQRVADFLPLVEAQAADHAIGQAERHKALFEFARLEAGAHQDRHLASSFSPLCCSASISSPTQRASSSPSQTPRSVTFSPSLASVHSVLPSRPSFCAISAGGGAEDVRRRAVILLEPDDLRAGEILLEAQDVADLGAAPGIDRLVVVADAAEILVELRQQPQPEILRDVGVLILVDQDVAEAVLIVGEDVGPAS